MHAERCPTNEAANNVSHRARYCVKLHLQNDPLLPSHSPYPPASTQPRGGQTRGFTYRATRSTYCCRRCLMFLEARWQLTNAMVMSYRARATPTPAPENDITSVHRQHLDVEHGHSAASELSFRTHARTQYMQNNTSTAREPSHPVIVTHTHPPCCPHWLRRSACTPPADACRVPSPPPQTQRCP